VRSTTAWEGRAVSENSLNGCSNRELTDVFSPQRKD